MSLFGAGNANETPRLHQLKITQSVNGIVVPIIFGRPRVPINLLWNGDLSSTKESAGGKGGGKDGTEWDYKSSVVGVLCEGKVAAIGNIWSSNGRLTTAGTSDLFTLVFSGTGTTISLAVSQAPLFAVDNGVSYAASYSVTANDYGSSGSVTLAGTQQVPMKLVTGTPTAGEYSTDGAGNYMFAAADAGKTVTISYTYSLYTLGATEDYNVPDTSPYELTVENQTSYASDGGVIYVATGLPLTKVGGTPSVAGTYNPNGGNYLFAPADANAAVAISYNWKQNNSNVKSTATLAISLIEGTQSQSPWSYLTSTHASQAFGYSGLALVVGQNMDMGTDATLPPYNYEVCMASATVALPGGSGIPSIVGGGIVDADVAASIIQLLTNPLFGAEFDGTIDASLTGIARNYWGANSFFISPVLDSQRTAAEIIDEWCEAGNVGPFWSEGKAKFIPYGDTTAVGNGFTFTPQTQPVVDLTDDDYLGSGTEDPITVTRKPWQDAFNQVKVQFTNRVNNYNPDIVYESDDYSINQFGLRQESQKDYSFLCTQAAATFAANIRLKRLVYIRATYNFTISAIRYGFLEPMDLVTLTDLWLGISKLPVRITSIKENDKYELEIEAEEFPWGTATATLYPKQVGEPYQPVGATTDPGNTTAHLYETTPQETVGAPNTIYAAACGSSSNWGGCEVWISSDGTTYTSVGKINGSNRIGVLTAALPAAADPDTTDTLSVALVTPGATLSSGTLADCNNFETLCAILNSDGSVELISYETATLTGPGAYNLTYLRRGVYGTKISAHAAGANFVRVDAGMFSFQYPAQYATQTIYGKFTSFNLFNTNEQSLAVVSNQAFTIPGTTLTAPAGTFSISPANPLSAQAVGSTAKITVASFTDTLGSASVSCTVANPITGLNQGQLYYVYYVDTGFVGGAITPIATQNPADFTGKVGYYLIGSITTPSVASGTYRPSTYSDTGANSTLTPTYAYDTNPTSSATVSGYHDAADGVVNGSCTFSGFAAVTSTAGMKLYVFADFECSGPNAPTVTISYNFNVGSGSVTLVAESSNTSSAIYSVTVPTGTFLSAISVTAATSGLTGVNSPESTAATDIYDIYIQ